MGFDLNTVPGFAAVTGGLGGISSVLTSLTGAINNKWDIAESSYGHDGTQVLFHVFKTSTDLSAAVSEVRDEGGRRKIPVVFPYVDGQGTDDLGRMGVSCFEFNVLIHGNNYRTQYKKFLQALVDPRPGTLIHPVRGRMTVAASSWEVTHSSQQKRAVALRVRFIEHTFDISYDTIPSAKDVPSALGTAIGFIAKIANIITAVESNVNVFNNTVSLVKSLLGKYNTDYSATLGKLNSTFNTQNTSLIPGLAPTVAGQDPTVFSVAADPSSLAGPSADVFLGTGALVTSGDESQAIQQALAAQEATDQVKTLRTSLDDVIAQIEATEGGQGALIFSDEILTLKQSAISMQSVLEVGLQSSKNRIVSYMTPRDMSAREVCFANGLTPDSSGDIEILNPALLSLKADLIPKGTIVQVPL